MSKEDGLAWHFSTGETSVYEGSLPATKIVPGLVLTHDGPLNPCHSGLHYSYRAIDALEYAPGTIISRVRISDERVDSFNKGVARTREVLWMGDVTTILDHWLCNCLEKMLLDAREHGFETQQAEWDAIEVQRRWIAGDATPQEVIAARDRASVSARAWASARASAWTWASAASASASARAWAWAWASARTWQNDELERLLTEAFAPKEEII